VQFPGHLEGDWYSATRNGEHQDVRKVGVLLQAGGEQPARLGSVSEWKSHLRLTAPADSCGLGPPNTHAFLLPLSAGPRLPQFASMPRLQAPPGLQLAGVR
jgi:hypothetical protein